jgi:peptidoglycan hydrolase CwlO-like protein
MDQIEKIKNLIAEYGLRTKYVVNHPNNDLFYTDQKKAALDIEKEFTYILTDRNEIQKRIEDLEKENTELAKNNETLTQLFKQLHGIITK